MKRIVLPTELTLSTIHLTNTKRNQAADDSILLNSVKFLKGKSSGDPVLVVRLRSKPYRLIDLLRITKRLGLTEQQIADFAEISTRSLKTKSKISILSIGVSEKLVRIGELITKGLHSFDGNESSFLIWLNSKIPALGYETPSDLITSHLGIKVVEDELIRIENGIY